MARFGQDARPAFERRRFFSKQQWGLRRESRAFLLGDEAGRPIHAFADLRGVRPKARLLPSTYPLGMPQVAARAFDSNPRGARSTAIGRLGSIRGLGERFERVEG